MKFTLTIEADSFGEIDHLFHRDQRTSPAPQTDDSEPQPTEEAEPEAPTPKPTRNRGKKADAAKQDTPDTKSSPESSDGQSATTDAFPSDEPAKSDETTEKVSFEDLRAKASALMDSGKVDGRAVQEMLISKFDVRAFGPLKEEQYPAVMDALEELAA